jgi:hypothetical protein
VKIFFYLLVIILIPVVFFSFREVAKELKSGKAKTRVGFRSREKNPEVFWLSIAFTSLTGLIALGFIVFVILKFIEK